jgi:hypothetical protein
MKLTNVLQQLFYATQDVIVKSDLAMSTLEEQMARLRAWVEYNNRARDAKPKHSHTNEDECWDQVLIYLHTVRDALELFTHCQHVPPIICSAGRSPLHTPTPPTRHPHTELSSASWPLLVSSMKAYDSIWSLDPFAILATLSSE